MTTEADIHPPTLGPTPAAIGRIQSSRLGEELPIFCERCGYSLNGLPQGRCAECNLLHFHCPECGHRQPINTLRPAAQRILGKLRVLWLCFSVFFKLNVFGWLLVAWWFMGVAWSYEWDTYTLPLPGSAPVVQRMVAQDIDFEGLISFAGLGLACGLVGRIFLLRWRRGYLVGLVLGTLVVGPVLAGAWFEQWNEAPAERFARNILILALEGGAMALIGAWISWPIWTMLVKLLLPKRAGAALLEWQRTMANSVGKLGQE